MGLPKQATSRQKWVTSQDLKTKNSNFKKDFNIIKSPINDLFFIGTIEWDFDNFIWKPIDILWG